MFGLTESWIKRKIGLWSVIQELSWYNNLGLEKMKAGKSYDWSDVRRIKIWGWLWLVGEADADNGIGVCLLDEEIAEIGYKDIAF